jgi:aryl-alcohol dehydrogenase-like predicted oxidoreductase
VISALEEVAQFEGSTMARVALAWLLEQPGVTAPIASATNEKQFADLVEAAKLELDPDSIKKLNQATAQAAMAVAK